MVVFASALSLAPGAGGAAAPPCDDAQDSHRPACLTPLNVSPLGTALRRQGRGKRQTLRTHHPPPGAPAALRRACIGAAKSARWRRRRSTPALTPRALRTKAWVHSPRRLTWELVRHART